MFKSISTALACNMIAAVLLTLGAGCSSSNNGATKMADLSTKHNGTYLGSGSVWQWNLKDDGSFSATKKATIDAGTNEITIAGSYTSFATGFYKFTVDTASGSGAPSHGDQAYGFGVPGVLLILKTIGSGNGELLVMPALSSTCPNTTTAFNWVQAKPGSSSGDLISHELWGDASIEAAPSAITGSKWTLNGAVDPSVTLTNHTGCNNGTFTITGGFIQLTTAGVGIVKNNSSSESDIIALPKDTSVNKATLQSKNFVGLVFSGDGSSGTSGNVSGINVTFKGDEPGTYSTINDVENGGTGDSGNITIEAVGSDKQSGFVKLKATGGGDKSPTMWAAVVSNIGGSNRTFFFGSGMNVHSGGGAANEPFSIVAIQK